MRYISRTGTAAAGIFVLITLYFIVTQGVLTGTGVLMLGSPWVFWFGSADFFNVQSAGALSALILLPILLNIVILYAAGLLLERFIPRLR